MATKPKDTTAKVENKEVIGENREEVVAQEPKTSFDERTQATQPWLGSNGVDDTRPEPAIEGTSAKAEDKE